MNSCELCVNFVYDEQDECYQCLIDLDEDELYRFLNSGSGECSYFRPDDEYSIARKQ